MAKSAAHEADEDDCLGLAAQLAFYFLLALFPALLFVVAILGYLPVQNAMAELLTIVSTVAPPDLVDLLAGQLEATTDEGRAGLATLGLVGALWSSSAAMAAIIKAMNRTYGVAEWRPWWRRRILALALTGAAGLFIALALLLMLTGSDVAMSAARRLGMGDMAAPVWAIVRWPAIVGLVILALDVVYYVAPNRSQRWAWVTPGAVVATVGWVASSLSFKLYVTHFGSYNATYGAIGGVIVVLVWLYLSGLAILIGAEINSVLAGHRPRQ